MDTFLRVYFSFEVKSEPPVISATWFTVLFTSSLTDLDHKSLHVSPIYIIHNNMYNNNNKNNLSSNILYLPT